MKLKGTTSYPIGMVLTIVERMIKALEWKSLSSFSSEDLLEGYQAARAVYVDGQNLKVNLVRFREMLIETMKPLGGSTP
ncbi:hypothetical protein L3X38_023946 [Prunus dulcis]|uniref:Uncharacterized protein n=1 Tax=Prunus dulcis TaxID=3755 RepID=A0AAD4W0H4_PRUDU|nr:hypothetical protein L3X38_023946 [Prunus dulcis]